MTQEQQAIVEGAFAAGFEPSGDDLPVTALLAEAQEYLYYSISFTN